MIQLTNVKLSYPDGKEAIINLSLNIKDGESVALVGANGAGKSSLLLGIVGAIPLTSGNICIDGVDVGKKNLTAIREQVGLVFQNPDDQLFMPTIYEDIAFGLLNHKVGAAETKLRVEEISQELNAESILNKMSHKLSGGEKRLAAIASVLIMKPKTLLLDEPSAYLDPRARKNLIGTLKKISITKIIATHDLDMAIDLCERVVILRNGELIDDGAATTILRDQELLTRCGLELPLRYEYEAADLA